MKIVKFIILLLLGYTFSTGDVFSCNFNFKSFGSSPDNKSSIVPGLQLKDKQNNIIVTAPIENFCSEEDLKGTAVTFLYIENGLAKITIERHNFNDRNILKYAILQFGDFKRSKAIEDSKWTGSHFWNLNFQIVGYVAVHNSINRLEKIELTSALYANKIMSDSTQLEK
jgi:hypothetical protein